MCFNTPKRNTVLLNCIEKSNEEPKVQTLKKLCATRWVQRYDAVSDFIQLFSYVVNSLDVIKDWNDTTFTDASLLLQSIDTEFLISLNVVKVI